ncbi:hypothetical protein Pjdr2_0057 [Paenibacillus sp. JDR-2]|nr:hypothetical protein Pjdr2_0057 [Paenibacillus sp. JDR-2]
MRKFVALYGMIFITLLEIFINIKFEGGVLR